MIQIFVLLFTLLGLASPREEAILLLEKLKNENDIVTRLDFYSREFLNLPYGNNGPLGEGPEGRFDQDPLYRFDTFDCTTFVETAIGLALSAQIDNFEDTMNKIRYQMGQVDYMTRNHFPSLQWIPHNVQNFLLKEINGVILPSEERAEAQAIIDIPGWLAAHKISAIQIPYVSESTRQERLDELHAMAHFYVPVLAKLDYIPLTKFLADSELLKRIPHGSLVNFVRPNWDLRDVAGTHMNVSHQGLLFWKKEVLYLRHASSSGEKQVTEVPFLDYLKKFENHPTLKGVHFMALN